MSEDFEPIKKIFHKMCTKCKFWHMNYHRRCPRCEARAAKKQKEENITKLKLPTGRRKNG